MSAQSWLDGNASLKGAHYKYGQQFADAYRQFRDRTGASDADLAERAALWNDYENRGENVMVWFRKRQC